ncbi:hypothetical protein NMG60_11011906 [Bertholletia excelsa]
MSGDPTRPTGSSEQFSDPSCPTTPSTFVTLTLFHTTSPRIRFSTGFGVTGGSALIHEFYSREVSHLVHQTVDTGFKNAEASIKAFVSLSLSLGDQQLAAQFQEIPLDLCMVEAERTTMVGKLPNDLEGMEASMERLLALIDDVYRYVDDVVEGRVAADDCIGRFISDTAASIPKISPLAFDRLVNDSIQQRKP